MKKDILAIILATVWVSASEFFRNQFLFKSVWIQHYNNLGLIFPSSTINGIVWVLWSFLVSVAIYFITKKFTLLQTTFLSWVMVFVLMWLVIGNLGILPYSLIAFAIPLSFIEIFVATVIIVKTMNKAKSST